MPRDTWHFISFICCLLLSVSVHFGINAAINTLQDIQFPPDAGFFLSLKCVLIQCGSSLSTCNRSLSKCSPWFGGHSVVKILAQWFVCDDTPNAGPKKPSWSQLSDGVSCLSWWFIIFMSKSGFVSRNGKKGYFLQQWNCIAQLQKTNSPIIYFAMVECQCVLKCWGHQLYNDLAQKKVWI